MIDPLEDGTKHINISYQAKTPLGRMLSPPYTAGFELPDDGYFLSVGGYWRWLVFDKEESHRTISGEEVFLSGSFDSAADIVKTQEFKEKILRATWHKIRQNHKIFWRFEDNVLSFERYYVYEDRVYKPSDAEWLCDGLTVMDEYIHQNFW